MDFFSKNKKIFLFSGIFVAVIVIYMLFFSGGPSTPTNNLVDPTASGLVSDVSASPSDAIIGQELLAMLAKLKSISLDTSFFNDQVFLSLKDKSRLIEPEPLGASLGRRNPFFDFANTGTAVVTPQKPTTVSH